MRPLRDLSIGLKIGVVAMTAAGVALLVTGLVTLVYEATTFRPSVTRDLESQARVLRPTITAGLSFLDERAVEEDLESFAARPGALAAAVYDGRGRLFASWRRDPDTAFTFPPFPREPGISFTVNRAELWTLIEGENLTIGHLVLARAMPPLYARMPQYRLMLLGIVFAVTLALAFLVVVLRRTISRPILDLSRIAAEVRDHKDYSVRAPESGSDEVGVLTVTFNQMLAAIENRERALERAAENRQALREELSHAHRMESIGRLAGGVAHDFNNYLTVIGGSLEMALAKLPPDSPVSELLLNSQHAADQAAGVTRQLLAFARKQVILPRPLDLGALASETRKMLRSLIKEDIELRVVIPERPWMVWADPSQLTQVLMNLATNARDAMPEGGELSIEIRNLDVEEPLGGIPGTRPGQYVQLTVADTGEGMTRETREHLFEPFFTTKEPGAGTGLGLATSYGIILQSGGQVRIDSRPGDGTRVHVYLRRHRGSTAPDTMVPAVAEPPAASGDETVLVVEDNAAVRDNVVAIISSMGYRTLAASTGAEALLLAEHGPNEIDLLVTDVVLPGMSGPAIADELRKPRPQLKVLYMSGYTADEIELRDLKRKGTGFIAKPFKQDELARRIRELIDRAR